MQERNKQQSTRWKAFESIEALRHGAAVSYTHLDVYKRQVAEL